jgi:thioredoxin 1
LVISSCTFYIFFQVDVDELEDLAAEQEVKAMPTFSFFKGGKKLESFAGANKDKIKATIEKHL